MTLALASSHDPSRFTRRGFLSGSAALIATSLIPRVSVAVPRARDFFTPEESTRRRLRQLDGPLCVTTDGTDLSDTDFVVSPRFKPTNVCAALYIRARGVKLRNVRVITEFPRWDPAWALSTNLRSWSGVSIAGAKYLTVDGLHIEGFPHCAMVASGLNTAQMRRMSATACFMGFAFGPGAGGPLGGGWNVTIDQLAAWDTWGPAPAVGRAATGCPSRVHPGGWVGGDGFAGYLTDSTLSRLTFSGELFTGFKIVRSKRVFIDGLTTNQFMIQGTETQHANSDGLVDGSEDITVRRLLVDKRISTGIGAQSANGIQASFNIRGLQFEEFTLISGLQDGHGIQLWGDVEASFRGGVIIGFNGMRGRSPAYALEYGDGSTVNADFEAVNWFFNQKNLVRRAA